MSQIARTPPPPYWAVIFTSLRTAIDEGYAQTADAMVALAAKQPGFLGVESTRDPDGLGITVSYWASLEAIAAWKAVGDHAAAQRAGRAKWYSAFTTRVAQVTRVTNSAADVTAGGAPTPARPSARH